MNLGDLYAESGQNFTGLVLGGGGGGRPAVSKPNFASKYALESSRRDLRDLHNAFLCTVVNAQNLRQKSLKILLIFSLEFR